MQIPVLQNKITCIPLLLFTAALCCISQGCGQRKGDKGFGGAPAAMREQFAQAPSLYFEKNGKELVLAIMQHRKIISYSRRGNMIQKQAVTTYYLQTNDAITGAKLAELKVKEQASIKNHPVVLLGSSGTQAWAFIGELMCFDVFTLEKKADLELLEQKNRGLTGKFPQERRYYLFDPHTNNIYFTATDGTKWELNTSTLLAAEKDFPGEGPDAEEQMNLVENAERKNQADLDSLYQLKDRIPSKQYAAGQISRAEYDRIAKEYRAERDLLNKTRDSLREVKHRLRDAERAGRDRLNNKRQLETGIPNYSDIRINQDTIAATWYGLYSPGEFQKLNTRMQYSSEMDETARRQLYVAAASVNKSGEIEYNKAAAAPAPEKSSFLHGGFLLDRKTALPIHLPGTAFLIVHKDQVGKEAALQVSLVQTNGKINRTVNTEMKEWADWICTGKQLILMGTNNPELSSGEINVLLIIDLVNGKTARYDYYTDKVAGSE